MIRINFRNKRTILTLTGAVMVSILAVGILHFGRGGADSEPPIVTEVRHHGDVLKNHEDRIGNTEKDVNDLQNKTQTPPSSSRTVVREVTSSPTSEPLYSPTSTASQSSGSSQPVPAPITVVAYEQIPIQGSENMDCKLTYSDGTTKVWRWKTVIYNQGSALTSTAGICDGSVVGDEKG